VGEFGGRASGVITTHQSMHVENEKPVESLNQNDTDLDGRFVFFPLVKRIKKYSVGNPEHKKHLINYYYQLEREILFPVQLVTVLTPTDDDDDDECLE
jgi:hypothetical protein